MPNNEDYKNMPFFKEQSNKTDITFDQLEKDFDKFKKDTYHLIENLINQFMFKDKKGKYFHHFMIAEEHTWSFIRQYFPDKYKQFFNDLPSKILKDYDNVLK